MSMMTRRTAMLGLATTAFTVSSPVLAAALLMHVYKDPNCGCCEAWVQHVRAAGFVASVTETRTIKRLKDDLGVPKDLHSCHTAEVDGYVIEGHVPAQEIRRLLMERPTATGIAVAGMPIGSPGMEFPGSTPERYEVVLFGPHRRIELFARYRGHNRA
jgi:hypothetical protein